MLSAPPGSLTHPIVVRLVHMSAPRGHDRPSIVNGQLLALNALTQNQRGLHACHSPRRQALLTYQTSGEVVADLANREVECRFKGTGIAFGLGKQQATLQGG